jgi:hypothetical protein
MSNVVDALVAVMHTGKPRKKPDPTWVERAAGATGDAKKLLDAVASWRPPTWELGGRFIVANINTFTEVQQRLKLKSLPFDVAKSCELGCSYIDITWGFHWDGIEIEFVEIADKERKLTKYTPDAWFANLRTTELAHLDKHGYDHPDDLIDSLAACGAPIAEPRRKAKKKRRKAT